MCLMVFNWVLTSWFQLLLVPTARKTALSMLVMAQVSKVRKRKVASSALSMSFFDRLYDNGTLVMSVTSCHVLSHLSCLATSDISS